MAQTYLELRKRFRAWLVYAQRNATAFAINLVMGFEYGDFMLNKSLLGLIGSLDQF